MENEKESISELREEVRKLKREVCFFQILFTFHLLTCIVWGFKYNELVEAINLITERLDWLEKSVGLCWEANSSLIDVLKELVCQLQRAFEVLRG